MGKAKRSDKGKLKQSANKADKEGKRLVVDLLTKATRNDATVSERTTSFTSAQLATGTSWVAHHHSEWTPIWDELSATAVNIDKPIVGSDRTFGFRCPQPGESSNIAPRCKCRHIHAGPCTGKQ